MKPGSILYISDKEFYEGIVTAKKHFPDTVLRRMALQRGILYGKTTSREEICGNLAQLVHDYWSLQEVGDILLPSKRRVRYRRATIDLPDVTPDTVEQVLIELKEQYAVEDSAAITLTRTKESIMNIHMKYVDVDLSRTTLHQKQEREGELEVVVADGTVSIRAPATDKSTRFICDIADYLGKRTGTTVQVDEIDLSGITDAGVRTSFFIDLMEKMPDMKKETVQRVYTSSEFAVPNVSEEEDDDTEDEASFEFARVLRADLHGNDILSTPEYKRLCESGFFITEIRWHARSERTGYVVEYIAGFNDAAACSDFYYDAIAISRKPKTRDTSFRSLLVEERRHYLKFLESAAMAAFKTIVSNQMKSD
jgi:hypothetical protein